MNKKFEKRIHCSNLTTVLTPHKIAPRPAQRVPTSTVQIKSNSDAFRCSHHAKLATTPRGLAIPQQRSEHLIDLNEAMPTDAMTGTGDFASSLSPPVTMALAKQRFVFDQITKIGTP